MACAATAATAGEPWRYLEPQAQRPVEPSNVFTGADGSTWLFGNDGVRRVDANGATTRWIPASPPGGYSSGKPTADDGAVAGWSSDCTLTRLDATPSVRWRRRLPDFCVFAPASDDAVWVANYAGQLFRLDAAGSIERQLGFGAGVPSIAAMPDGGVALLASDAGVAVRSTLTRYERDGTMRWSVTRENVYFGSVAASADGTLTIAGVTTGASGSIDVVLERYGANGVLLSRYARPRDPGRAEGNLELRLAPDGSASIATAYFGPMTTRVFYRFGTDGRLLWRKEACVQSNSAYLPEDSALPLAGGETAVACSGDAHARFLRIGADGSVLADAVLPTLDAKLGLRADGALHALGTVPVTFASRLYAVDLAGREVNVPAPLAADPLVFADRKLADDGTSWLLSRSALRADPHTLTLAKIDANGALAWRRTFDATSPRATLSVAGGQACVAQSRELTSPWPSGFPVPPPPQAPVRIDCVASADGVDRWSRTWPADGAQHFFSAVGDGTFVHLRSQQGTHEIVRHDAAGNELTNVERAGYASSAAVDTNGEIAAGVYDPATQRRAIVRYDAAGAAHPTDVDAYAFEVVGIVQGRIQAMVSRTAGRTYEWYGADGTLKWSRLPSGTLALPVADRNGTSAYVVERLSLSTPERQVVRLVRIDASNGATVWTGAPVFLRSVDPSRSGVAVDASATQVAIAHATADRMHVARFAVGDGAAIGEQFDACGRHCGEVEAVAVGANGTVRVALPIEPYAATGATVAAVALPDTFAQAPVRLDQPGLTGAWWAPYANGEGFVADWLPASRTWFMPWFTFLPYQAGGVDMQRWYAIAGQIPEGATQAELPILQTTGGKFDAAGGVTSRQVGTAVLRFTDCDNGTLRYAFDPAVNDGAAGTITLSRLTPATQDCVRADGSVQAHASTPANGFDARLSGSWFEEATSGQGLQFTVQPGGIFFAPWFTFDPAGTSEPGDPGRQRWYSLQGSLAGAVDGRAELVIGQALGGTFDDTPADSQAAVGTATLTVTACDRATLDYRFDASAGDLGGRTGSIALTKIGGCSP